MGRKRKGRFRGAAVAAPGEKRKEEAWPEAGAFDAGKASPGEGAEPLWIYCVKIVLLFLVYFVAARFVLQFEPVGGFATLFWPPTGIALAALFLFGSRLWPAVLAGAFLANFLTGASIPVAVAVGAGNAMEALIGASLLHIVGFRASMQRMQDVVCLVVFAAFGSTMLSATIGTTALLAGGLISFDGYFQTWSAWWGGDALSDLIVAPFLFTLYATLRSKPALPAIERVAELAILLVIFSVVVAIGFGGYRDIIGGNPATWLIFIPVVWGAIRFGPLTSATILFVMFPVLVMLTKEMVGPFRGETLVEALAFEQFFLAVLSVTSMVLSAVESERRRAAGQLFVMNLELERRVEERTRRATEQNARAETAEAAKARLKATNEELRKLDRIKDQFLMLTSHELKTPLTPAIIQSQMLLGGHFGKLNAEQEESIRLILRNSKNLNRLVNDILDLSMIREHGLKLRISNEDVLGIISETAENMGPLAKDKGIIIIRETVELPKVRCDAARVSQVLTNLIDNAVKFTPKEGSITIGARRSGDEVVVSVRDSGIGISGDNLGRLFSPFFQVNPAYKHRSKGVGLGLAICRGIVEAHGGRIWAESELGSGTAFHFTLPLRGGIKKVQRD